MTAWCPTWTRRSTPMLAAVSSMPCKLPKSSMTCTALHGSGRSLKLDNPGGLKTARHWPHWGMTTSGLTIPEV